MRCEATVNTTPPLHDNGIECRTDGAQFCTRCELVLCGSCADEITCIDDKGHQWGAVNS
jgi:hypothetical protein